MGTSASTVVRLLAKLGYDSYAQAQTEARAEVTARLASPGERADAMGADGHGARACLHNALLHDQHNLQATFSTVDPAVFEAAVRALTQRKARVHVLGLRQAAPLAGYAALYLNLCLPTVRPLAAQGPLFLEDQLLWVDERDVLLAFTFRRYSVAAAKALRVFRERGAKVVLITDSASAPAARWADQVLVAQCSSASPFDSYTAPMALCLAGGGGAALQAAAGRGARAWRGLVGRAMDTLLNASACRSPGETVFIFP